MFCYTQLSVPVEGNTVQNIPINVHNTYPTCSVKALRQYFLPLQGCVVCAGQWGETLGYLLEFIQFLLREASSNGSLKETSL